MPTDANVARKKSCLGAFVFWFLPFYFLQKGKNVHGALVGLTLVKGTSMDKCFSLLKKKNKGEIVSGLIGLT